MSPNAFVKPEVQLVGTNGNIFNTMAIASCALKKAGYIDKANEMMERVTQSGNYDSALAIILEYIDAY